MQDEQSIDDLVLYHGSLAELNSRDSDKQYKFAGNYYMNSTFKFVDNDKWLKGVAADLGEKGVEGLVNMRTVPHFDPKKSLFLHIEGTPIVRIT